MPYSLVSSATLGFDLVRLPAGRSAADVLLTGLTADAATLQGLAGAHPAAGRDRGQRAALAVDSRRARVAAAAVPRLRTAAASLPEGARAAVLVAQLERSTIGDAGALERVLREDVLGPEHPAGRLVPEEDLADASDVLADAAVGAWAAAVLPPAAHRSLTAPFAAAVASGAVTLPAATPDLGPATGHLIDLLAALRGLDAAGRDRWRAAVDAGRTARRPWAAAMHEASWAAHVSGRTRALATAQLLAVQAFLDAGFDGTDGAGGVWNAVAGCVQGIVMADLIGADCAAVLTAPLG